jgi:lysophospholipase L1-like esterase
VKKQLSLVATATVVGLLVAEGLTRLLGINPGYDRLIALGETPTRIVDGVVLWQDDEPRASADDVARAAADHDAFTIVGLGDSIMYGVGQKREQTYLEQARHALAEHGAGAVDVVNLAVPGYNTLQEDAVHRELGDRLAANLVLLHYWSDDARLYRVVGGYVVDVGDMSADGRLVVRALPIPPAINDFLLVHSRLYELLTAAVIAHDRRATAAEWSRVSTPLVALQDRVQRAGGRLLVLASPDLAGNVARPNSDLPALRQLGAEHGFEVIDVSEWLKGVGAATIRLDGCHFNAEGHRLLGEQLAQYLLAHDLNPSRSRAPSAGPPP